MDIVLFMKIYFSFPLHVWPARLLPGLNISNTHVLYDTGTSYLSGDIWGHPRCLVKCILLIDLVFHVVFVLFFVYLHSVQLFILWPMLHDCVIGFSLRFSLIFIYSIRWCYNPRKIINNDITKEIQQLYKNSIKSSII